MSQKENPQQVESAEERLKKYVKDQLVEFMTVQRTEFAKEAQQMLEKMKDLTESIVASRSSPVTTAQTGTVPAANEPQKEEEE